MNQDDFVAGVLYRSALNDEQVWRKDPKNCHDVKLFDEMIAKIRKLGYNYKYYPDISMRRHEDPELIDIIADYLGKFTKEGITAELVRSIGTKSGQVATVRILDSFFNLTDQSKRKHAAFLVGAGKTRTPRADSNGSEPYAWPWKSGPGLNIAPCSTISRPTSRYSCAPLSTTV